MAAPLRSATHSRYRWDARTGRYLDRRGRFVSRAKVRQEIDRALAKADRRAQTIANQLRAKRISVDRWEAEMRKVVKQVHSLAAAAARGGWAQLSPADYGRIGRQVREQYRFLARFADQLDDGLARDGRFLLRVQLYTQAGRGTYHRVERQLMRERGMTEELSVLNPADHCDLCLEEAARGWVPIGTLIPIGQRTCLSRCRCTIRYR